MTEIYKGKTTKEYMDFYHDKPQEILIETVGPCNLRCIGCPQTLQEYRDVKWKPAFMDMELYASILRQAVELWPPINVGLYHTGEVTMLPHARFREVVHLAKHHMPDSKGWDSVGFYTNGLLMDAVKRAEILNAGINWVRLSFDGGTKEAYEKVRIGSHFETVFYNALALAQEAKARNAKIRLEVIFVPYAENEQSIREFHKLWAPTGWKASTGGTMNYGGLMQEAVEGRRHIYQGKVRERHSVPCPRVFEQFTALVDGRVSLCSADPMGKYQLGDLTKHTLKEVWEGLRRSSGGPVAAHMSGNGGKIYPCEVCDYTEYCGTPAGEYFGEVRK